MLLENFHLVLSDHLDNPKTNTGQFKKQVDDMETLEKVKANWNQSNSQKGGDSQETKSKIRSKIEMLEKAALQFNKFVELALEYVNIDIEKYLPIFVSQGAVSQSGRNYNTKQQHDYN